MGGGWSTRAGLLPSFKRGHWAAALYDTFAGQPCHLVPLEKNAPTFERIPLRPSASFKRSHWAAALYDTFGGQPCYLVPVGKNAPTLGPVLLRPSVRARTASAWWLDWRAGGPALPPAVCWNTEAQGCERLHQPAHTSAGQLGLARARTDGELALGVRCHA